MKKRLSFEQTLIVLGHLKPPILVAYVEKKKNKKTSKQTNKQTKEEGKKDTKPGKNLNFRLAFLCSHCAHSLVRF